MCEENYIFTTSFFNFWQLHIVFDLTGISFLVREGKF